MSNIIRKSLGRLSVITASMTAILLTTVVGIGTYVLASSTSEFQQAINPGTLSVDIVNASYASVANPSVAMSSLTFSYATQDSTGTLGTNTEQLYVQNPDAADNGWTLAIAAANISDLWTDGGSNTFDFNNAAGSGYTNGQMTIDASGATLAAVNCASCTTDDITKGSSTAFNGTTTPSVTLLTAAATSSDIGRWSLKTVAVSQKIPLEQAVANYAIDMVLTITAA